MWRLLGLGIVGWPLLLVTFTGPADGQVDVAAALVGRWEGKSEIRRSVERPERILIIKGVRPAGTEWKADGLYGITADRLGRVDLTVTVADSSVTVEFLTPYTLHVSLKLVKPNILEGSHTLGGSQSARMRLDRKD